MSATQTMEPARGADSLRDTIDSIVVAFILAFVFRAFIVEAFVIPTGSMAPTLYGAHGSIRCANCAYPFAVNMKQEVLTSPFDVQCPNCGDLNNISASSARPFLAESGDRILVHKWPYDIGGPWLGPRRWDVTVFKDPKDSETNYIKRLVGLPGEVLELIDGDLYTAPAETVPPEVLAKLDPARRERLTERDYAALDRVLRIQRKTRIAQSALWMAHYDHDYPPRDGGPRRPHWVASDASAAWDASSSRLRFTPPDADRHELALAGKPARDLYGYNSVTGGGQAMTVAVPDLRVAAVLNVARVAPGGYAAMVLTRDGLTFEARLYGDGRVTLALRRPDRPDFDDEIGEARTDAPVAGRPVQLALSNVDYAVTFEVAGRVVLASNDAVYAPSPGRARRLERAALSGGERAGVRLAAAGMPLELWHVVVQRDVYYQPAADYAAAGHGAGEFGAGTRGRPIHLRPGEYFMCGDNSPQSMDSRMWTASQLSPLLRQRLSQGVYQVGTVPEDQLIGRAFFVYWPAGKRLVESAGPAVIPNVGRMRMIR